MANYQEQIQDLTKQNELLKQLGTTSGFYQYYFSELKHHRTNIECFNTVNDLHLDLFGEYRYSCWKAFVQSKYYTNKK